MPSRRKRRPKLSPSPASASCRPASHRGQGISPELITPSCFMLLARPPPFPQPPSPSRPPHPLQPRTAPPADLRRRQKHHRAPHGHPKPPAAPVTHSTTGTAAMPPRHSNTPLGGPPPWPTDARRAPAAADQGGSAQHRSTAPLQPPKHPRHMASRREHDLHHAAAACIPELLQGSADAPNSSHAAWNSRQRCRNSPRAPPPLHAELPLQTRELALLRCRHLHSTLAPASTP
nr:formin-like protein 14 [Lolium perenne]